MILIEVPSCVCSAASEQIRWFLMYSKWLRRILVRWTLVVVASSPFKSSSMLRFLLKSCPSSSPFSLALSSNSWASAFRGMLYTCTNLSLPFVFLLRIYTYLLRCYAFPTGPWECQSWWAIPWECDWPWNACPLVWVCVCFPGFLQTAAGMGDSRNWNFCWACFRAALGCG